MLRHTLLGVACLACLPACTALPFALAPGAEKVLVTNVAADLAGCTAVGNIQVPTNTDGFVWPAHATDQLKNQAIGFGGNAAFVTEGTLRIPQAGVAYHCPTWNSPASNP
jgi:hypothetical protein